TETFLNDIAKDARKYNIPTGLGELLRTAVLPTEDPWITRGLGAACQYLCYGLTNTDDGDGPGLIYDLNKFKACADIELTYWKAGKTSAHMKDYAIARGAEFLWMMYMSQRVDDTIFNSIAQSDVTCMLNVARAIDSSIPDSVAIQTNVVPIYNDWLICNLVNDLKDESFGGIYTYDILPDTVDFGVIGQSASFVKKFSLGYPIDVWIGNESKGMDAPIWAAQYVEFTGAYADYPTMYFNGMYADDGGSGSILDGKWTGLAVTLNEDETAILSVNTVSLNDLYNGSFELAGGATYLVVTNNNEGGQTDLRFVLSQDTDIPDVLLSAHQNTVNDQYITLYTTLYDTIPEGFDWYGPIFTASTADSTGLFNMSVFYETLWSHRFTAWEPGAYTLQIAGYDSTGFYATNSIAVSVDYVTSGGLTLSMNDIHLNIAAGAAAPGTMVSMCESNMLGLAVETQTSLEAVRGQMTGILAGPVSIPSIDAVISFPAENSEGAVYNYTADGWSRLESWFQNGRMSASVSDGGNYAFGSSPGVSSPEIPANFRFSGTYPNPFSAEAAISFSLPSTGHVNVTIYDMTGRAIRTLSDTEMMAAEYSLIWDGLDETGHAVGAGVYFCRLQACGETVTQKMLRIE
ncbi:MAG: T9SS type A sorting domain-containing protein, partial [Candidatus Aegiribacteria sp.]|nr:T9SS type A sorting domain-containing protein [Candidatus Aegiribacteria sp.]